MLGSVFQHYDRNTNISLPDIAAAHRPSNAFERNSMWDTESMGFMINMDAQQNHSGPSPKNQYSSYIRPASKKPNSEEGATSYKTLIRRAGTKHVRMEERHAARGNNHGHIGQAASFVNPL